jgi:hypothetical protein
MGSFRRFAVLPSKQSSTHRDRRRPLERKRHRPRRELGTGAGGRLLRSVDGSRLPELPEGQFYARLKVHAKGYQEGRRTRSARREGAPQSSTAGAKGKIIRAGNSMNVQTSSGSAGARARAGWRCPAILDTSNKDAFVLLRKLREAMAEELTGARSAAGARLQTSMTATSMAM